MIDFNKLVRDWDGGNLRGDVGELISALNRAWMIERDGWFERGAKAMKLAAKRRCEKQHSTCDKSNVGCHVIDAEAIEAIDVKTLIGGAK